MFASGGFDLEAAQAVTAREERAQKGARIGRLVDKSLVVADHGPTGVRHRMLQTLAEYALERLRDRGEEAAVRRRHAEWVAELAATVELQAETVDRAVQVALVQAEAAEVDQALGWALANDPELAVVIASRLGFFWTATFQTRTGWAALSASLEAAPDAPEDVRAKALAFAGLAGGLAGAEEAAAAYAAEGVALDRASGDPQRIGRSAFALGGRLALRGRAEAATPWLAEARRSFTASGDERGLAYTSYAQGFTAALLDDVDGALAFLDEAEQAFRRLCDPLGLVTVLVARGDVERGPRPRRPGGRRLRAPGRPRHRHPRGAHGPGQPGPAPRRAGPRRRRPRPRGGGGGGRPRGLLADRVGPGPPRTWSGPPRRR